MCKLKRMEISSFEGHQRKLNQVRRSALKFVMLSAGLAFLLVMILYVVMISVKTNYVTADSIDQEPKTPESVAEKIIYAESRRSSRFRKPPPQPFANIYVGPTPQQFTPTTQKTTTLRYAQLSEYRRRRHHPKSIQDIIAFMTFDKQRSGNAVDAIKAEGNQEAQGQLLIEKSHNKTSSGFSLGPSDPFYYYKPQDPGDINLLATGAVRFAPPIWKTLKKAQPKPYQPQVTNSNRQEIYSSYVRAQRKPIIVSLNIYPYDNDGKSGYGQASSPYRIQAFDPTIALGSKQERMIIHLNIFPENVAFSEDAQESRLRGNFVGYVKDGI